MALIALGVTGGIGAYKAVEIARGLQQAGHDVQAVMTRSARKFVGEVTFEAITRRRVVVDQFARGANADIEHIALASSIDLLLVAPATAHTIGRFANGLADDFLTALYLATRAPVLLAPAMNTQMWEHPAVVRNLATLADRGVRFVEPGEGYLACGWIGKGRLAEADAVVAAAQAILGGPRTLAGRTVVVTAGPTCEDLDPVRFLGNRSSGRMGFALAAEASRRGAIVVPARVGDKVRPGVIWMPFHHAETSTNLLTNDAFDNVTTSYSNQLFDDFDDGGNGITPLRTKDNFGSAAFHNGDTGVGGTQINTNYFV